MLPPWQAVMDARRHAASLPRAHPRRIGWRLLDLGVILFVGVLPFDLPLKYAALGIAMAGALLGLVPLHRLPGFRWALVFAAWLVATDLLHPCAPRLGLAAVSWLAIYLAAAGLADPGVRRWGVRLLLLSLALSVGLALAQLALGYTVDAAVTQLATYGWRWGRVGSWHSPVVFGNQTAALALLFLLASDGALGLARRTHWEARVLAAAGVYLSLVRMAFLAVAGGVGGYLLAFALTLRGRRWRRTVLLALCLGLPVALFLAGLAYYLRDPERIHRLLRADDDRFLIWRTGLSMLRDHWLLGTGTGADLNLSYLAHHPPDRPIEFGLGYFNLHNTPLTLAVQHGVAAAILWFGWLVALVLSLWRRRETVGEAWPLGAGLVSGLLVLSCFDHFAGRTTLHLPMYAALGLALGLAVATTDDGSETA